MEEHQPVRLEVARSTRARGTNSSEVDLWFYRGCRFGGRFFVIPRSLAGKFSMAQFPAKFPGTCPKCGVRYTTGTTIQWQSGEKARHVTCPQQGSVAAPQTAPVPRESVPTIAEAPFVIFEKWRPCKRSALPNAVGETKRLVNRLPEFRKGAESFGEAARPTSGVYVVVSQQGRYETADDNEDMGDCSGAGWQMTLYCRPASEEEVAQDTNRRVAESIPVLGLAIQKFVERSTKQAFEQRMKKAAEQPQYSRGDMWRFFQIDGVRTEVWKDGRGSYRVTVDHPEGTVYLSYDYIYDWDQPTVVVGPLELVEALKANERQS
jgi:hypothetical protein